MIDISKSNQKFKLIRGTEQFTTKVCQEDESLKIPLIRPGCIHGPKQKFVDLSSGGICVGKRAYIRKEISIRLQLKN